MAENKKDIGDKNSFSRNLRLFVKNFFLPIFPIPHCHIAGKTNKKSAIGNVLRFGRCEESVIFFVEEQYTKPFVCWLLECHSRNYGVNVLPHPIKVLLVESERDDVEGAVHTDAEKLVLFKVECITENLPFVECEPDYFLEIVSRENVEVALSHKTKISVQIWRKVDQPDNRIEWKRD